MRRIRAYGNARGLLLSILAAGAACAEAPLRLHPANPHYFLYRSKPAVLITSGEHYGSVLNLDFDYVAYLDELRRNGFNLTRTFSGSYREQGTSGHGPSPLSPGRGPRRFIAPWAWSDTQGGFEGTRFDLDRWNPAYFARLKDFCRKAHERGVVVELVLFCRMYDDERWRSSPLHPDNNLQGSPWRGLHQDKFLTPANAALLERQQAVTRKIVTELRDAPNVYFEIANEPSQRAVDSDSAREIHAWHEAIIGEIVAAEASLAADRRHLIAYNADYAPGQGIGPIPKPEAVGVINFHYLMRLAETLAGYGRGKALGFDETRWIAHPRYPEYRNTMTTESGRVEAWEFLLGGGAVYSNLNHAYQVEDPSGRRPESELFKGYLRKLMQFVTGFDFVRMRPDHGVVAAGLSSETSFWRALIEPGRQYAIYIHHSAYAEGRRSYRPSDGSRTIEVALDLPRGSYRMEWIQPADLAILDARRIDRHPGGRVRLTASPQHQADIALRIRASR